MTMSLSSAHLRLVVPDVDVAIVQAGQHPRLLRVQVHTLHPVRPRQELALYERERDREVGEKRCILPSSSQTLLLTNQL